ncbi:hypothetical protein [Modestobacter marinus]|uniref:hypothetical protein n=1 Tax=Modestobacter marinus TaxID=477641 RepID=UPI001C9890C3|nr:hypothetical protein [Modestobacter marinus]
MTSLLAHRVRALASSVLEGLAVGGLVASREAPPWSRPRVLISAAAGAALTADQASLELPAMLREHRATGTVSPAPPHERRALAHAGAHALVVGLLLQVLDRPVRDRLAQRGVRHPHRWFGAIAAVAHLAALAPVYWRLAADRARADAEREAAIEAELQEMAAGR